MEMTEETKDAELDKEVCWYQIRFIRNLDKADKAEVGMTASKVDPDSRSEQEITSASDGYQTRVNLSWRHLKPDLLELEPLYLQDMAALEMDLRHEGQGCVFVRCRLVDLAKLSAHVVGLPRYRNSAGGGRY